ncbi:hypothetical protein AVEN_225753-1 [Araneus ventricosus]|uniref:Uncharacterized protein n=1 Tax=Araneus ventricosus TaxID=182803 RepID=A0A4Y2FX88_ARAVE|nr:hypothetical protein AVEN_225753-1 [Araneus ventricosus]
MLRIERLKWAFSCFQLRNIWFQHDGAHEHKRSSVKHGIREKNNRVWWFPRVASTFTLSHSNGIFPVGIPQTTCVCDPSANVLGPSTTHYGCLCQRDTRYATPYAA